MLKKILSLSVIVCFFLTTLGPLPVAHADSPLGLPAPGSMVNLSPAYEPMMIKGLTVHKDNPFLFDFIVDTGNSGIAGDELKNEGDRLVKYFLACLTIPEKDLWVNLSPYEKDRMVPQALGQTALGRDLLAEDYILKQLTASLIYPEKNLGKAFWDRVYTKAREMYGTTQIPVNTFNKVWIMADKATVYEHNQTVFVIDGHLKVMLEEDYLALQKHSAASPLVLRNDTHSIGANIVKQIILPEIEKEVNTGKNFSTLRQIFNSLILASWYKKNLKEALLNQVYANRSTVKGVNLADLSAKEKIYQQYLKAYKKGVFNYIKEDAQPDGQTVPRKYFSGGFVGDQLVVNSITPQTFGFRKRIGAFAGALVSLFILFAIFQPNVQASPLIHNFNAVPTVVQTPSSAAMKVITEEMNSGENQLHLQLFHDRMIIQYWRHSPKVSQLLASVTIDKNASEGMAHKIFNSLYAMGLPERIGQDQFLNYVQQTSAAMIVNVGEQGPGNPKIGKLNNGDVAIFQVHKAHRLRLDLAEMEIWYLDIESNKRQTLRLNEIVIGKRGTQRSEEIEEFVGGESAKIPFKNDPNVPFSVSWQNVTGGKAVTIIGLRDNINYKFESMEDAHNPVNQMEASAAMIGKPGKVLHSRSFQFSPFFGGEPLVAGFTEVQAAVADLKQAFDVRKLPSGPIFFFDPIPSGSQEKDLVDKRERAIRLGVLEAIYFGADTHIIPTITFCDSKGHGIPPNNIFRIEANMEEVPTGFRLPEEEVDEAKLMMVVSAFKQGLIDYERIHGLSSAMMTAIGPRSMYQNVKVDVDGRPTVGQVSKIELIDGHYFYSIYLIEGPRIGETLKKVDENVVSNWAMASPSKKKRKTDQNVTVRNPQRTPSVRELTIAAARLSGTLQSLKSSKGITRGDRAALVPGGIDLNTSNGMQWKDSTDGIGVEMNVDPEMIARIRREGINSLSDVIFKVTPLQSIWPLAGLRSPAV